MTKRSHFASFHTAPRIVRWLVVLVVACGLAQAAGGCGAAGTGMGATPGGAQDNDLARDQIDRGLVPEPEDITVEGMLNDHDLPLESAPCERDLCIDAAYGIAPALDTARAAVFVQMGFASGIDRKSFRRSPLNLAVVVDRSGSMAGAKIESVRAALSRLIDQLDERDRLAIVLFDDRVDLLWESSPVSDRQAIRARLPEIWARGSTDMASGLRAGFAQVQHNAGRAGVSDRVIVLTDAMTNTGDTDTTTFIELAQENASRGIGLTLFGVGLDLNQELVLAVSKLRGGNYVFLTEDKIATVFDVDFDYLVTPLAYDLRLSLTPQPGFRIAQVYGYPSFREGSRSVEIAVATVFLSRNHGAIVARLEREGASWPAGKPPLAALSLSYEPRGGGERAFDSWQATCEAGEGLGDTTVFYSQRAVRKTVALVNAAIGMRRGCELFWQGSADAAQDLVRRVVGLLRDEGAAIEDAELRGEADDAQRLLDNMLEAAAQGAPACRASGSCQDPYDPYGRRRLFACNFGAGQSVAASGASPAGSLLLLGLAIGLARVLRRGR